MMSETARILVVDDDRDLCRLMAMNLQRDRYQVSEAYHGRQALEMIQRQHFDLLITDIMMPEISGLELLRRAQQHDPLLACILVTGVPNLESAVEAIQFGASAYLMKPCSSAELVAAAEEALQKARRARITYQLVDLIRNNVDELDTVVAGVSAVGHTATVPYIQPMLTLGGVNIHRERYQIGDPSHPIDLTPTEFDLLMYLVAHRGRIVPCLELVEEIRGYRLNEEEAREVIRPHISNLRRKLKLVGLGNETVINVRGLGYRLSDHIA